MDDFDNTIERLLKSNTRAYTTLDLMTKYFLPRIDTRNKEHANDDSIDE